MNYLNNQLTSLLHPGLMSLFVYLSHSWHEVNLLFIFVSQTLGTFMEYIEWRIKSINAYIISKSAAYYRLKYGDCIWFCYSFLIGFQHFLKNFFHDSMSIGMF